MFTLVVGETQFPITADDAARYLNDDLETSGNRNPHFIMGRCINPRSTKDVAIYGPAMQSAKITLRTLRDHGYRA